MKRRRILLQVFISFYLTIGIETQTANPELLQKILDPMDIVRQITETVDSLDLSNPVMKERIFWAEYGCALKAKFKICGVEFDFN